MFFLFYRNMCTIIPFPLLSPPSPSSNSRNKCYKPVADVAEALKILSELSHSLSFSSYTYFDHVKWVPCHHGRARPQVADRGDGLQIWRVAAILHK
jgi:hypothetical protein